MAKKDDDREVQWAPRRIRELEGKIRDIAGQVERMSENLTLKLDGLERRTGRFASTVDEMGNRVRTLEGQTGFETSEDDARLKHLNKRLRDVVGAQTALAEKVSWVQDTGAEAQEVTDRALDAHNERISQIESRLNAYGVPVVRGEYREGKPRIESDGKTFKLIIPQGSESSLPILADEDHFSPPIGGRMLDPAGKARTSPDEYIARSGPFGRGYVAGWNEALEKHEQSVEDTILDDAVMRVSGYMRGHFSEATIGGVVEALKGRRIPQITVVRDGDEGALHGSTEV